MKIRNIHKNDFDYIISVLDAWWGGPSGERLHPVFFYELGSNALIAEDHDKTIGFLFGFITPPQNTGYVHLVGIHPEHRKKSVGKELYLKFMEQCKKKGVEQCKAITNVGNETSIAFHKALGFTTQVQPNYAGKSRARIVFTKSF